MTFTNPLQPLGERLTTYAEIPQAPLQDKRADFEECMRRTARWAMLGLPHSDPRSVRYAIFGPPKDPTP